MMKRRIVTLLHCFIAPLSIYACQAGQIAQRSWVPFPSFPRRRIGGVVNNVAMERFNNGKSLKGFTLIEIMVVIAIIGILSSFLVDAFTGVRKTARDAQRKSSLRIIQSALEIYRSDKGKYPNLSPINSCGGSWIDNGTVYIQTIPCDPLSNKPYTYTYSPAGGYYDLIGCLENLSDKQKDATNKKPPCSGTTNWSYTLKNP